MERKFLLIGAGAVVLAAGVWYLGSPSDNTNVNTAKPVAPKASIKVEAPTPEPTETTPIQSALPKPAEQKPSASAAASDAIRKAEGEFDGGDAASALKTLESALDKDPSNADLEYSVGLVHAQGMGDAEKALQRFEKASSNGPVTGEVIDESINMVLHAQDPATRQRASEFIRQSAQSQPSNLAAQIGLAEVERLQGRSQAAAQVLERARGIPGAAAEVSRRLGEIHAQNQQWGKATTEMNNLVDVRERELADARAKGGDISKEEKALASAQIDQAFTLKGQGKLRDAEAIARPLAEAYPHDEKLQALYRDIRTQLAGGPPAAPGSAPRGVPGAGVNQQGTTGETMRGVSQPAR